MNLRERKKGTVPIYRNGPEAGTDAKRWSSHKWGLSPFSVSGNGAPRRKPHREDLAAGEVLCSYCTAKCCRYFALPIDPPTTWREFDYMRWFLLHDRATVFTEDGAWYLLVHTPCKHLRRDNLCGIYETRPGICREYTTARCEYEDAWVYDHYWETAEQVEEYAEAVLGPRRGRNFRSPRPAAAGPSR